MKTSAEIRRAISHFEAARVAAARNKEHDCFSALTDLINALEWALGSDSDGAREFQGLVLALDLTEQSLDQDAAGPAWTN